MSKLYYMNRMAYGASAGDPFLAGLLKGAGKLIGGLFKKKGVQQAVQVVSKAAKSPVGQAAIYTGAGIAASELIGGGGGGGRGASGGWARRRSRGITARELRGYRKVANLIHKEGMVSRRARGRR